MMLLSRRQSTIRALVVVMVALLLLGCTDASQEEVNVGHDPEGSESEGGVPNGSEEFLGLMTEMVERSVSRDYGEFESLAKYRDDYETGLASGDSYDFEMVSGQLDSVGAVSPGHNPFGVPTNTSENLKLVLSVDGAHRAVQVLIGLQMFDDRGELVRMTTSEDLKALKESAPIGAKWIAAGVRDASGTFFASSIIASRQDGTAVSFGPPIGPGRTFEEFEAQAAALPRG